MMLTKRRRRLANKLIFPLIAVGAMALTMFAASTQRAHRLSKLPSSSATAATPSR
ncbi:MAG: hypothetical protein AB7O24_15620 [Kofleriaceae bacterium]